MRLAKSDTFQERQAHVHLQRWFAHYPCGLHLYWTFNPIPRWRPSRKRANLWSLTLSCRNKSRKLTQEVAPYSSSSSQTWMRMCSTTVSTTTMSSIFPGPTAFIDLHLSSPSRSRNVLMSPKTSAELLLAWRRMSPGRDSTWGEQVPERTMSDMNGCLFNAGCPKPETNICQHLCWIWRSHRFRIF